MKLAKRYKEYWINEMEKSKTYFFSEKEVEEYVRSFPQGTKIIMQNIELPCESHMFR